MVKEKLEAIAQAFNLSREALDLDLDEVDMSWDEVNEFIAEENISYQTFSDLFLGGTIKRETVSRHIKGGVKMSRSSKLFVIIAFKFRMEILENAPKKYNQTPCPTCGVKSK